jgi:hypothetical protein
MPPRSTGATGMPPLWRPVFPVVTAFRTAYGQRRYTFFMPDMTGHFGGTNC